ncbi:hypothetical protein QBC47DRAFT_462008 [Echria macrotheca]|uniref:Uncharacterized protein n=1 Tax=Echria macrotheca TaxID=438768 RepID=A0AAJ0FAD2_9PEZI|nr:hypothetical protein QBC47DRAFT_462008 [Echria macrotheca]
MCAPWLLAAHSTSHLLPQCMKLLPAHLGWLSFRRRHQQSCQVGILPNRISSSPAPLDCFKQHQVDAHHSAMQHRSVIPTHPDSPSPITMAPTSTSRMTDAKKWMKRTTKRIRKAFPGERVPEPEDITVEFCNSSDVQKAENPIDGWYYPGMVQHARGYYHGPIPHSGFLEGGVEIRPTNWFQKALGRPDPLVGMTKRDRQLRMFALTKWVLTLEWQRAKYYHEPHRGPLWGGGVLERIANRLDQLAAEDAGFRAKYGARFHRLTNMVAPSRAHHGDPSNGASADVKPSPGHLYFAERTTVEDGSTPWTSIEEKAVLFVFICLQNVPEEAVSPLAPEGDRVDERGPGDNIARPQGSKPLHDLTLYYVECVWKNSGSVLRQFLPLDTDAFKETLARHKVKQGSGAAGMRTADGICSQCVHSSYPEKADG